MDINKITFKDVFFNYENKEILKGVSLEIKKGDKMAIVGPSGEGKTSMLKMLLKFEKPDSGKIIIDGKDLEDVPDETWYSHVGILSQQAHIFNRSIRDNLKIARETATDGEIKAAMSLAGLDEYMKDLKDGLDTVLGSSGSFISGGERSRIALARLILRKPEVVILDEPLEGVDKVIEREVVENIKNFVADKTMILVSHRFTILSLAEEFAVLEDGKITEYGKIDEHSEDGLLKKFLNLEIEMTEKFRVNISNS